MTESVCEPGGISSFLEGINDLGLKNSEIESGEETSPFVEISLPKPDASIVDFALLLGIKPFDIISYCHPDYAVNPCRIRVYFR